MVREETFALHSECPPYKLNPKQSREMASQDKNNGRELIREHEGQRHRLFEDKERQEMGRNHGVWGRMRGIPEEYELGEKLTKLLTYGTHFPPSAQNGLCTRTEYIACLFRASREGKKTKYWNQRRPR